ncbi:MAG: DUF3786 domain-containing protein [Nitrospirota bacterium]|nr:MAG: DUF3786 domain-containing protein [Nitrospirota bacterium]
MIPIKIDEGLSRAWNAVEGLDPIEAEKRTGAVYEQARCVYRINTFGTSVELDVKNRSFVPLSDIASTVTDDLRGYSELTFLSYLVSSKRVKESGKLIRPVDIRGGHIFSGGTHMLPLGEISGKYGNDIVSYKRRGVELGASSADHGDSSLKLMPLPDVPVYLVLWAEDDEFAARADLLFDSTIELQLEATDVIWALAMMTVLMFLSDQ